MSRAALVLARLAFGAFWLLTAAYCVMAYVPFTYVQVIQSDVVPSLNTFARLHPYLFWAALAAAGLTMREDVRRPATRVAAVGFLAASAIAGVTILFHPLLASLTNDASSLGWAFVALVPPVWLAALDVLGHGTRIAWGRASDGEDRRLFHASLWSGLFLACLYGAIFELRFGADPAAIGLSAPECRAALLLSLASHVMLMLAAFTALVLMRSIAAVFASSALVELAFFLLFAVLLLASVLRSIVLSAISLRGVSATAVATAVAVATVAAEAGVACRIFAARGGAAGSGLEVLVSALAPRRGTPRFAFGLWVAALAVGGFALAASTAAMDWNYLLQKVGALLVWLLVFAAFYTVAPAAPTRRWATLGFLAAAVLSLGAYKGLEAGRGRVAAWLGGGPGTDLSASLARYAGHDPSFKVAHDLLSRPRSAARDDAEFYRFLQAHTNIPRSVHIEPRDVSFVPSIVPSPSPKPDIFVFVIDSLRRDYLSAYNPAVGFTPAIGEFARESVVFTNAFTRYGGTGLSEPSIWVGGMIPHQQYVTPFYPMNALEKLLEAEGYRSFVALDTVLRAVVKPSRDIVELDRGVLTHALRLGHSVADLEARLRGGEAGGRPVFAYAQPQDLHVSTIAREGPSVPPGESYPGFHAPYAWRVRRVDAAFGGFLRTLRDLGLYENSIIVLTSDHGDSLGEEGRWGHAYTIFPEILRIPLIVHLPTALRSGVAVDPGGLSFLTDITPSLYALLGHPPQTRSGILGRSLFASRREDLPSKDRALGSFLVASSYGPVFGVLRANGRSLYIADSVNYADDLFDLATYPGGTPPALTDAERAECRGLIRDAVDSIDAFYEIPRAP
ncbi:MAG: sulfatase-like hydrolase/transferase [Acidobacteriia bacterium]|nr:sulfatase-like hydrolase/transferase [Terriglobia bacterium]